MAWFDPFESQFVEVDGLRLFVRHSPLSDRHKPALLLLHGFPQTHAMWHRVAQGLRADFFIVMPDLRGYGHSMAPAAQPDHSNMSKRAMAQDVAAVMDHFGINEFHLCGHDRGARVAHRMALDHSARIKRLCLMDIAPTLDMYNATDMAFARAYYHWFHLIQPAPIPEQMIGGNPISYLHSKLGGWGTNGLSHLEPEALQAYEQAFSPEVITRMCDDYRASAGIDLDHDRDSRARGDQIACDTLVLWGSKGVVHRLFDPMALWQAQCAARVVGETLPCGHFLPEEQPEACARALRQFLQNA
jgi:haloacetate dehalogenase